MLTRPRVVLGPVALVAMSLALPGCYVPGTMPSTCCPSYAPPAPAAPGTGAASAKKMRIVLRGVNFDFDRSDIRPDAQPVLDEAARILKENPDIRVAIEGHTDGKGTVEYNQGLSERRAMAVLNYLIGSGIAESRLMVAGYSELQPVATNETEDGRAQNRRVELRVLG